VVTAVALLLVPTPRQTTCPPARAFLLSVPIAERRASTPGLAAGQTRGCCAACVHRVGSAIGRGINLLFLCLVVVVLFVCDLLITCSLNCKIQLELWDTVFFFLQSTYIMNLRFTWSLASLIFVQVFSIHKVQASLILSLFRLSCSHSLL
jgi:hypothetical protein